MALIEERFNSIQEIPFDVYVERKNHQADDDDKTNLLGQLANPNAYRISFNGLNEEEEKMAEGDRILRRAAPVGALTMVSRVVGLVRDVVIAYLFGARSGPAAGAFYFAFVIPNMFRRLLAEGIMSIGFIPVFSEYKTTRPPEETRKVFNIVYTQFTLFLGGHL